MLRVFSKVYVTFVGIFMGIADTLPGISGSTITYVMGIYEKFIDSINNLLNRDKFYESFYFLFKIGIGWILGAFFSILFLEHFAENNIYFITSLFLGLIFFTIYITLRDILKESSLNMKIILFLSLGILVTFLIFLGALGAVNYLSNIMLYLYVFSVSVLAIGCMLLPGISGSMVFLIFGIYYPIINCLSSFLHGDFTNFKFLVFVFLGVIVGLFLGAKVIQRTYEKNKINFLSFILGVLIGSIFSLIYSPLTIPEKGYEILKLENFNLFGFLLGVAVLVLLNYLKEFKDE